MKKIIPIVLAVLLLSWFVILVNKSTTGYHEQMDRINELKVRMEKLEVEQDELWLHLKDLQDKPAGVVGKASWYDYELGGEIWSKSHLTAAARDFPRYSTLLVCNANSNSLAQVKKCVEVFVNDFGPQKVAHPDRIVDLSSYAFSQLAPLGQGVIEVEVSLIK